MTDLSIWIRRGWLSFWIFSSSLAETCLAFGVKDSSREKLSLLGGMLPRFSILLLLAGFVAAVFFIGSPAMLPLSWILGPAPSVYSVVFDAGSTGTRVNVFRFDQSSLRLSPLSEERLTLYEKIEPGLSSFAEHPDHSRKGIKELLANAAAVVPLGSHSSTSVSLAATAGLRLLPEEQAKRLLQVVREELMSSPFELRNKEDVFIMDGEDEAKYMWVTINYAVNKGIMPSLQPEDASLSTAVVDLGGGSVQLAYQSEPSFSPTASQHRYIWPLSRGGEDDGGPKLFVNSWLGFGLKAARMKMLEKGEEMGERGSPCFPYSSEWSDEYSYAGEKRSMKPDEEGNRAERCEELVVKTLGLEKPCGEDTCLFQGVWKGPEGKGLEEVRVFSYLMDLGQMADLIPGDATEGYVSPKEFLEAAGKVCDDGTEWMYTRSDDAKKDEFSKWRCFDLTYAGVLLEKGFGLKKDKKVRVGGKLRYFDGKRVDPYVVEAAWPLGMAVAKVVVEGGGGGEEEVHT